MDAKDFLKREIEYTRLWCIVGASLSLWLAPKYLKSAVAWELAAGLGATSAMLTAAHQVSRLEKQAQFDRVQQAAQQDLFTSDMAMQVYLNQIQQQQQINAMIAPHQQAADSHPQQQQQAIQDSQPQPIEQLAPENDSALELLQQSFTSRIFFGAQRTGKSYLAACAARRLADRGVTIFHINLNSYGDEDDRYWAGYRSVACDLLSMSSPELIAEHIQEAMAIVDEFKQTPQSILVVDEWTLQCSTSNRYQEALEPLNKALSNQIAGLTSTGMKRERAIWAIAPEFVAGGLTQEGKAAKKLSLVFVAIPPNQSVDWKGQQVTFNPELYEQVRKNFPYLEMPIAAYPDGERIAFIDKNWTTVGVNANSLSPNGANGPTNALEPYQYQGVQGLTNADTNVHDGAVQAPFSWVPANVQKRLMMAIASGSPKAATVNQLLGISKGGSSAWQKASSDWDDMKRMLNAS